MAERAERNLRMLQSTSDPGARRILCSVTFATAYEFNRESSGSGSWHKMGVEGPAFLVERQGSGPMHRLVLINRSEHQNFQVDIQDGFESQLQDDFLLLKTPDAHVLGLWIGDETERNDLVKSLQASAMPKLLQEMFQQASVPAAKTVGDDSIGETNVTRNGNDIETLELSKEELKDVLLKLVQTEKFIDILHQTYTKSVRMRKQQQGQNTSSPASTQQVAMPIPPAQHQQQQLHYGHQPNPFPGPPMMNMMNMGSPMQNPGFVQQHHQPPYYYSGSPSAPAPAPAHPHWKQQ